MEIQGILKNLREKNNLTQEQLAERVQVTRQAVSRWETGETQPNTDTLKLLSRVFDVSINTLLGSPRQLVCQCCGMPLNEDGLITVDALCEALWGDNPFGYENSLNAHVRRVREKIEADPSKPVSLITIKGLGYKLITRK